MFNTGTRLRNDFKQIYGGRTRKFKEYKMLCATKIFVSVVSFEGDISLFNTKRLILSTNWFCKKKKKDSLSKLFF